VKAVSDRGSGDRFPPSDTIQHSTDWSSDGRWIFYQTSVTQVNSEIWLASAADRKIMPLLQTRFDNVSPALSPNREYLAFCANDTSRHEIYMQRFQEAIRPSSLGNGVACLATAVHSRSGAGTVRSSSSSHRTAILW